MVNTKYIYSQIALCGAVVPRAQMININSQKGNLRWIWFDTYHMTTFAFAEVELKKELIRNNIVKPNK